MKLIIAEKPSLGRNIINAIGSGKFRSFDGYAESFDYIVTWGFGHLFGLYTIEEYKYPSSDEPIPWTLEGLPYRPAPFQFRLRKDPKTRAIDPTVRKQFETILKLCARRDVECVISAGDADREGEIIIRIILDQAGNQKPVKRLWLPEQTHESIRAALYTLKPSSAYDNLANEGYARTYIDWLYGINLTRLATLKAQNLLRVGRVIVPIVKAIYDRDMLIKNFVPEPYLGMVSKEITKGQVITLTSKKTFSTCDRKEAEAIAKCYNEAPAIVSDVKTEKKEIQPGRLFSLSKLQGVLGKKFKMTPKESLDIVQKLYEAGYVTYPRTNTEYLAKAEAGRVNGILEKLQKAGYPVKPKDGKKSIYDDSKIESHSALTPTMKIPGKEDLEGKERQVYDTIFNRFVAVFCSNPCLVNRTTMVIDVGDLERFTLTGDVFLENGWMEYEETNRSDKILPALEKGELVAINFKLVDKKTSPPKHYTSDTLNKFLKNPFRAEKLSLREEDTASEETEDDTTETLTAEEEAEYKAQFEGVELGTEATRTSIIENAIASKYIALKNDTYTIQPTGIFYIESLEHLGICLSKEKTAHMGRILKQVYHGELSVEESVEMAYKEVHMLFEGTEKVNIDPAAEQDDSLGTCPKCGGRILEGNKAFYCSNKECKVVFFRDNKFLAAIGKRLSATAVKGLIKKGSAPLKNCKSAKTGKTFDCILTVNYDDDGRPDLDIEFPNPEDNAVGNCPQCGGLVLPNRFGNYGCVNWQKGCKFNITGKLCGRRLSKTVAKGLLANGISGEITGFKSKEGKEFSARLALGEDGKLNFVFPNSRRK